MDTEQDDILQNVNASLKLCSLQSQKTVSAILWRKKIYMYRGNPIWIGRMKTEWGTHTPKSQIILSDRVKHPFKQDQGVIRKSSNGNLGDDSSNV